MALIRCPIHGIPYNEDNPRGCPACALEKEGGEQAQIMRELARASQASRRTGGSAPPLLEVPPRRGERAASPVTTQPRAPEAALGWVERLRELASQRPIPVYGIPLLVVLLLVVVMRSRPAFITEPSPVPLRGEALPLPVEPGLPVSALFAVLGVQPPRPSPIDRSLERYSYGTDLNVDALNGAVYLISLLVPNRAWQGLRVGLPERQVEGALALLGSPQPAGPPTTPRADTLRGMLVYPSLDDRPRRTLKVEVRPPNGCYDVVVDVQPQAAGILVDQERRYAAIGRPGAPFDWVATHIRVINRAVEGPLGPAACAVPQSVVPQSLPVPEDTVP